MDELCTVFVHMHTCGRVYTCVCYTYCTVHVNVFFVMFPCQVKVLTDEDNYTMAIERYDKNWSLYHFICQTCVYMCVCTCDVSGI